MSKIAEDFWKTLNSSQRDFLVSGGPLEGKTDAEKVADAKRRLLDGAMSGSVPLDSTKVSDYFKSVTSKPYLYSVENVLATLGGGNATDTTGAKVDPREALAQKYDALDDLSRMAYRHNFENEYGRGSWQNVRKVVENARKDVESLKNPEKPRMGTAEKVLRTVFTPRALEAIEAGREPSWKDYGLDVAENALMAAPVGALAALPKVARMGKAAKVLFGLGTDAIVPHAMEVADAAAYSPEENPDRSVYSEADALIGSATNAVAPYMLRRGATRLLRSIGGRAGKETPGLSDDVTRQLDDLVSSGEWKKPTQETVDAVQMMDFRKAAGRAADEATDGALTRLHKEGPESLSEMELKRLATIYDVMADKSLNKPTSGQILEAGLLQKRADDLGVRAGDLLNFPDEVILTGTGTGAKKYSEAVSDIAAMKKDLANADFLDELKYTSPKKKLAADAAMTYGVNKYGSEKNAGLAAGTVNSLLSALDPELDVMKSLHTWKDESVKDAKSKAEKSLAVKVVDSLPTESLTDEDAKYLALIREKPGVLKGIGIEAQDPQFRNWMMLRGTDILRDTPLYRPAPLAR